MVEFNQVPVIGTTERDEPVKFAVGEALQAMAREQLNAPNGAFSDSGNSSGGVQRLKDRDASGAVCRTGSRRRGPARRWLRATTTT